MIITRCGNNPCLVTHFDYRGFHHSLISQVLMKDPFYIQWHITNFCNLRCKHCYQDDFSKKSDLDGAGLKAISDNILTALKIGTGLPVFILQEANPY